MAGRGSQPASPREGEGDEKLIGGCFAVDTSQALAGAGGGLPAFRVTDRRGGGRAGLMAVQVRPDAPPRANALTLLASADIEHVLGPLAHGPATLPGGRAAWFVICPAPPGPSLATVAGAWSERELLDHVLRPVAQGLYALQERHVTHRAIRPDNMFRAGPREPVALGAAWAAPPASLQPAIYEPPYSAMCLPAGRGEGSIADDVYALGVVLLVLATGMVPLPGLDDATIIRRKLELGSYAALVGETRLPPAIADLLRGMLAEDPEHRPAPLLLCNPAAAQGRRVAARPPHRAQRPLELAGRPAWTARMLAYAMATDPEPGARLLRAGEVYRWVRRSLGDPQLAIRLEDAVRGVVDSDTDADDGPGERRGDAVLVMRAIAALDPLAPLSWRNVALWPDGLGPALAAMPPVDVLQELVASEAVAGWGVVRAERCDPGGLRADAHRHRMLLRVRGWGGGLARLRYALNPLLPCRSAIFDGRAVVRLVDLLPALDSVAARRDGRPMPLDPEIAGFLAARDDAGAESQVSALSDVKRPEASALAQLRLLARLQTRLQTRAVPGLAAWLAEQLAPSMAGWRNRRRREEIGQQLAQTAKAGLLPAMLALLDDPGALAADEQGLGQAIAAVQAIDAKLGAIAASQSQRAALARHWCNEAATALGAMAVTAAIIAAVMS